MKRTHTKAKKTIKTTEQVLNFNKEVYPRGSIHVENREVLWHSADICVVV